MVLFTDARSATRAAQDNVRYGDRRRISKTSHSGPSASATKGKTTFMVVLATSTGSVLVKRMLLLTGKRTGNFSILDRIAAQRSIQPMILRT
jgi:hypothetical protein